MKRQRIRNVKQFLAKRQRELKWEDYTTPILSPITGYHLHLIANYQKQLVDVITNPLLAAKVLEAGKLLNKLIKSSQYGKAESE